MWEVFFVVGVENGVDCEFIIERVGVCGKVEDCLG